MTTGSILNQRSKSTGDNGSSGSGSNGSRGTRHGLSPADRRDFIPVLGLREYWYPGIPDKQVGKKPVLVQMLGRDVCFWRGLKGVVAFENYCPHRGAMMHNGDRWWPGTITCTYHGATFNEEGELLEFIGEGPESKIVGKMRCGTYPTHTLKGIVFVWMGEGEPAPIEENVPPEFFSDEYKVFHSLDFWSCNWRASLENFLDAHASYVHRNSSQSMWNPSNSRFRSFDKPDVVNGRALVLPTDRPRNRVPPPGTKPRPWREWYDNGKFHWPRRELRRLWVWAFNWRNKRRAKRPMIIEDREWRGTLMHLPSLVRTDGDVHQFTRWVVPVDEKTTRLFFFHSIKPQNTLAWVYEKIHFTIWNDWSKNYNFNGQDGRQEIFQYYDTPEKLSGSDVWTIAWRKLQMQARGMPDAEIEGVPEAEEFAGFEQPAIEVAIPLS